MDHHPPSDTGPTRALPPAPGHETPDSPGSPNSHLVDLGNLRWHEQCEPDRLQRLVEQLRHEPLRNSIHVSSSAPSIILDGAHRSQAAKTLGHRSIPAHQVPIPDDRPILGWTHVYTTGTLANHHHQPRLTGTGPTLGLLTTGERQVTLRAPGTSSADLFAGYWQIAHSLAGLEYTRSAAATSSGDSITWVIPPWQVLRTITLDHGPLPAGITNFADVFAELCPVCAPAADTTASPH